jgi:hypothetical protein
MNFGAVHNVPNLHFLVSKMKTLYLLDLINKVAMEGI